MKKTLSVLFSFVLALTVFTESTSAANFKDLSSSHTFYDEINYLYDEGIISGYLEGTFRPDLRVSRGEAAIMIGRALNLDGTRGESRFPDVGTGTVASGYIESAVEAEIITGFPDGTFRPNHSVTRAQLAIILTRAFELEGTTNESFSDVTSDMTSYPYIQKLLASKITAGYPDNTFRPGLAVTRGQFSAFMARSLDDSFLPKPDMKAHFIDIGQGDSTLIQTPGGANILIDGGIKSAGEKVVSFLKAKDVGKLDMVIATHPHSDHIGGLISVLNAFPVDKFIDSGNVHTSQTYLELLTLIDNKNIDFEVPSVGQVYSFDNGFKMTVLHVDSDASNANNASIVTKAEYGKVSIMLTGDAEATVENSLVNSNFNLASTIYKAGHHGSNTSSTSAFVNKVKPEVSILSYGKGNSYGHPHDEVVKRLQAAGSKLYSTENGDITVTTNGSTYSVSGKAWTPPQAKPDPKPEVKPDPKPDPKPTPKPETGYPVNINTANVERLQDITGVGPVIAQRIIDYRNANGRFTSKAQLKNVKGIGDVTYKKMESQITI